MSAVVSQITSFAIVNPTVYSTANRRKHQSIASLAFVRGIHRWPVNSPHKRTVMLKILPFDDVIMILTHESRNKMAIILCTTIIWLFFKINIVIFWFEFHRNHFPTARVTIYIDSDNLLMHRWPMDFPHKGPVTRKMFPLDDVIMHCRRLEHEWMITNHLYMPQ